MRKTAQHTFFFTDRDCFSNWYIAPFTYHDQRSANDITFNCVEQFMMYAKARIFQDDATAQKILAAKHPKDQKRLGREVAGYDEDTWVARRMQVVYTACKAKFTQHPALLEQLLATEGTLLVEASPYDKIWGIGMGEHAPGVDDAVNWKGQNLLGRVLTKLRDDLLLEMRQAPAKARSPSM